MTVYISVDHLYIYILKYPKNGIYLLFQDSVDSSDSYECLARVCCLLQDAAEFIHCKRYFNYYYHIYMYKAGLPTLKNYL